MDKKESLIFESAGLLTWIVTGFEESHGFVIVALQN